MSNWWFVLFGLGGYIVLLLLALAFVRGASIVSHGCCNNNCNQGRDCPHGTCRE